MDITNTPPTPDQRQDQTPSSRKASSQEPQAYWRVSVSYVIPGVEDPRRRIRGTARYIVTAGERDVLGAGQAGLDVLKKNWPSAQPSTVTASFLRLLSRVEETPAQTTPTQAALPMPEGEERREAQEREEEARLEDCRGFVVEGCDCSFGVHCWGCAEAHVDETLLAKAARTGKPVTDAETGIAVAPRYTVDCINVACGGCYDTLVEEEGEEPKELR